MEDRMPNIASEKEGVLRIEIRLLYD